MTRPPILPLIVASLVLATMPGRGAAPGARDPKAFLSVVLHDVVDERASLDADSTTTSDLVAFFEYLVSNGWHALTLDEVDRAGRGETTLPEKSILITIDDAQRERLHTRLPVAAGHKDARDRRGTGRVDGPRSGARRRGDAHLGAGARDAAERTRRVRVARLRSARHGPRQSAGEPASCVRVPDFRPRTRLRGRRRVPPSRGRRPAAVDRGDDARAGTCAASHRLALWPLHAERRRDRDGARLSLRPDVRSGAGPGEPPARDREVRALHRIAAAAARGAAAGRRHAAARSAVRTPSPVIVVAAGSRRDRAPARRGYRARPDPGRHRHRDRRGRAGTGRTSCGVVPDASDTRPRRRLPAVRVAISDSSGCAGVGAAARGSARYRRRRARGHLPRLRHLYLRGRSSGRRGQRAGGAWRRRLRRAVGGRRSAARHRRGPVAAEGATSTDLLQGRATRAAGSSARVGLDGYS